LQDYPRFEQIQHQHANSVGTSTTDSAQTKRIRSWRNRDCNPAAGLHAIV
jgi:hypothetical protein